MESSKPDPIHIIQDSRYAKQDGWRLSDISLCSSGNIAVSGHRYNFWTYRSFACVYGSTVDIPSSRDKPTLLYHKQFSDKYLWRRYISFIKPNYTEIITCHADEVQVIDYSRDVVLRFRKVNGWITCLSVSESKIFIGLEEPDIVNIYDNDLNRIKSNRLKGIRGDWPVDIASVEDRLYVCTGSGEYDRAIAYSQDVGDILTQYTTGQDDRNAWSIAVSIRHQTVAVLWKLRRPKKQVAVYSIINNNCLVVFDVEPGVSRIRISDQGRILTGGNGEVKIYDLAHFFTYDNLKITLSTLLSKNDLEELVKYFNISDDSLEESSNDSDGVGDDKKKAAKILTILEKKGLLQDRNFRYLKQAFSHLGSCNTSMVMSCVDLYQQHAGTVP